MSRPIVVITCMFGSSKSWGLNSTHCFGTYVPVEEPSTASQAKVGSLMEGIISACTTYAGVLALTPNVDIHPARRRGYVSKSESEIPNDICRWLCLRGDSVFRNRRL